MDSDSSVTNVMTLAALNTGEVVTMADATKTRDQNRSNGPGNQSRFSGGYDERTGDADVNSRETNMDRGTDIGNRGGQFDQRNDSNQGNRSGQNNRDDSNQGRRGKSGMGTDRPSPDEDEETI